MPAYMPIISKFDAAGIKKAEGSLKKFGKIATGIAATATAAVAGIATVGIKEFAKFDAALVKSQSIMGDLSDTMKTDMADAAREVAKNTTFSAEQAAESFYFLASAGLDAEASIAAMPSVAQFAQAGMFDMATATDLLTDAQSALGLVIRDDAVANMENMVRVSDTLAKASQLANATIEQFSTSLTTKAGTALKTVGKDVEEGAAALAVFADQGVKGELAGTQLTNTIFGLSDRAKAVPDKFEELGISIFDSTGQMRNFADIADSFNDSLGTMSVQQKLATLNNLGFTKQARSGLLLLMENGEALRNYEGAIRDAGGTTQEVAEKQLQSFSAQLDLAKSRLTDVGISIGGALVPSLLGLLDGITPIIEESMPMFVKAFEGLIPVLNIVGSLLPLLLEALLPIIEPLVKIADGVVRLAVGVFPAFIAIIEGALPLVNKLTDFFLKLIDKVILPLVPFVTKVIDAFMPLLDAVMSVLIDLLEELLPIFTIFLEDLIVPLTPALIHLLDAFLPIIEMTLPLLIRLLEDVIPVFRVVIEIVRFAMVEAIKFLTSAIDAFSDHMTVFKDFFLGIWEAISDGVKGIVNGILGFMEGFVNGVINAVNGVIRAVRRIRIDIPAVPPFFGGFSLGVPYIPEISNLKIPRLADGGIVMPQKGGVLANLAEAGKPEAVIPLDRFDAMGGNTYNINVNAGIGTDGQRVGQQIVEEIIKYEKLSGRVFVRA